MLTYLYSCCLYAGIATECALPILFSLCSYAIKIDVELSTIIAINDFI